LQANSFIIIIEIKNTSRGIKDNALLINVLQL